MSVIARGAAGALVLALVGGVASAQAPPPVDYDEPAPSQEPPPMAPPIVAPPPYTSPYAVPYYVPPTEQTPQKGSGLIFRMDLAGAYRYALKEQWGAAAFEIFLGGESGATGVAGTAAVDVGRSRAGLVYATTNWGIEIAHRFGERLRLGFNPHLGLYIIQRATHNDDMVAFMIGVMVDLSYDLVQSQSGAALFLVGKVGYDFVDSSPHFDYAHGFVAQLGLGFRL